MKLTQKITPSLWFDTQAEEAASFYVSLFDDSEILTIARYGDVGPGPKGSVMVVDFRIGGLKLSAVNGGPHFRLTPAISLMVSCKDQQEIDALWQKLGDGGKPGQCGWLEDRYGLSWQIVPEVMDELMATGTPEQQDRVMQAMLKMHKLDVAELQRAYDGA